MKEIKTTDVEEFDDKFELFSDKEQLDEAKEKVNRLYPIREVVSSAPTYTPHQAHEQMVIYSSAGTHKLYVWINESVGWVSTTLT